MPWYDPIMRLVQAIDTEYDRRIRGASNVMAYHPEGGHGHHPAITGGDHAQIEEEGSGSATMGALQGAGGSQYAPDSPVQNVARH